MGGHDCEGRVGRVGQAVKGQLKLNYELFFRCTLN